MTNSSYNPEDHWKDGKWQWADKYDHTPFGRYYTRTAMKYIFDFVGNGKGLNILDVGAGNGRFARPLIQAGHNVVALDIDERVLAELKKVEPEVETLAGDFMTLPVAEFDVVLSIGTIKYFNSAREFFVRAGEALKPGGHVIFEMPNPNSPRKRLAGAFKRLRRRSGRGTRQFSTELAPGESRELLRECGFRTIHQRGSFILVPSYHSASERLYGITGMLESSLRLNRLPMLGSQFFVNAVKS